MALNPHSNASLGLAPNMREFLRSSFRAFGDTQLLVAMHADAEVWWTAKLAAQQLCRREPEVAEMLDALYEAGFLAVRAGSAPSYRFAPTSARVAQLTAELARANREAPEAVLAALSEDALARIRSRAHRAFLAPRSRR